MKSVNLKRLRMEVIEHRYLGPTYPIDKDTLVQLIDELKEAREEISGLEDSNIGLGKILTDVCDALKGKPPPNMLLSTHDLGEVAECTARIVGFAKMVRQSDTTSNASWAHFDQAVAVLNDMLKLPSKKEIEVDLQLDRHR